MARTDTLKQKRAMIDALEKMFNHIEYQVNDLNEYIQYNKEYLKEEAISDYQRENYEEAIDGYEREIKAFETISKALEKLI